MAIDELGLTGMLARRLREAGFTRVSDFEAAVPRDLLAIPGVGPGALERVTAALATQGKRLAQDAYAPYACAREGRAAGDVYLTDLWLCEECALDFETGPFDGTQPEYVSALVTGYCVNCVRQKSDVALRQWYLCEECARVTRSFGRSVVASRALVLDWNGQYRARTGIDLVEVDPPRLQRRTGNIAVLTKASAIDYEGRSHETGVSVFGVEQKTGQKGLGRGSVSPMSEFQLDLSDCDDIAAVAERTNLPVFLLHAQVIERAVPPTRQFVPVGYWWTDAYSMAEASAAQPLERAIRRRPREARQAAYYPTSIFRPWSEFAQYVLDGEVERLRQRVLAEGRFPAMYQGQPRRT